MPVEETKVYLMSDEEIRSRVSAYKLDPGPPDEDVFGISTIFRLAGLLPSTGRHMMSGKEAIGPRRRLRLSKALIMVETGMVKKVKGKIVIGEPTRSMPSRLRLNITKEGMKVVLSDPVQQPVETMPSFAKVFVDNKFRLPIRKDP